MFYDIAITKEVGQYGKPMWGLFYAPEHEGPKPGDLFNAGEDGQLDIHRTHFALSGIDPDGEVYKVIKDLIESQGYPITSKIFEIPIMHYKEEEF